MSDKKILKSLGLSNYKAFLEENEIIFKNITLIFGHNNSGKSSIIECLSLLKQSYDLSNISTFATRGPYKIPTFREIISDGEYQHKALKISTEYNYQTSTHIGNIIDKKGRKRADPQIIFNATGKLQKFFRWKNGKTHFIQINLIPSKDQFLYKNESDEKNKICTINLAALKTKEKREFKTYNLDYSREMGLERKLSDTLTIGKFDSCNSEHPYWKDAFELIFHKQFFEKFIFGLIKTIIVREKRAHPYSHSQQENALEKNKRLKDLIKYFAKIFKKDIDLGTPKSLSEHWSDYFLQTFHPKYLPSFDLNLTTLQKSASPTLRRFATRARLPNANIRMGRERFFGHDNLIPEISESITYRISNERIYELLEHIYLNNHHHLKEFLVRDFEENEKVYFEGMKSQPRALPASFLSCIGTWARRWTLIRRARILPEQLEELHSAASKYTYPSLTLKNLCNEEEYIINKIVPLGVERPESKQVYTFEGTSPDNVGPSAEYIPDLLFKETSLVKNTNEWLQKLGFNYAIKIKKNKQGDLFEIRIEEFGRKYGPILKNQGKLVDINYKDVGTGVKSILPIVINSIFTKKSILTFQEPERSLHPKYQQKIADLFLEMSDINDSSFIVETHSEYLVYRFMKLVRDGKIKKDDISFNYVVKTSQGSKIKNLRIDEKGNFIDKWPEGFFDERLEMLME